MGDSVTRVQAQITIGNALTDSGQFEAARELLEHAVADAADQPDLAEGWVLANNLAVTYYSLGDFRRNLEFRERALAQAEKFALPDSLVFANTMVGRAQALQGEFELAEAIVGVDRTK